jgi:hypothetical protein
VPDQEPTSALSVCASCAVPLIDGSDVFDGATGAAVTTALAAEEADDEPALFEPVTTTRIVEPTSADVSVYAAAAAGTMSIQPAPPESQRRH